jgi:hypothetical protein
VWWSEWVLTRCSCSLSHSPDVHRSV